VRLVRALKLQPGRVEGPDNTKGNIMAKSNKTAQDRVLRRKVTKALPCKLTEQEVTAYGRDLARAYTERERIAKELTSVKEDYKAKIGEQEAAIGKFTSRVHSGIETREVECEETKNWTRATVEVVRLDTYEPIESRPMREDEKQMEMSGVAEAVAENKE